MAIAEFHLSFIYIAIDLNLWPDYFLSTILLDKQFTVRDNFNGAIGNFYARRQLNVTESRQKNA